MPPPLREQLSKFLVERALPAALQCPFRPFFNVSDARSIQVGTHAACMHAQCAPRRGSDPARWQVLNGCAALLLTTAQRVGAPAEAFICERSLPAAGCPPSLVAEFRAKLAAGQEPEFQQFFKVRAAARQAACVLCCVRRAGPTLLRPLRSTAAIRAQGEGAVTVTCSVCVLAGRPGAATTERT